MEGETKRNEDCQAFGKLTQASGIDVDSLLTPITSPSPLYLQRKPKSTGKKSTRQTKAKRSDRKKVIRQHFGIYDVVGQLENAPSGQSFGRLMRGDSKEAGGGTMTSFYPLKSCATSSTSGSLNTAVISKGESFVKVVPVNVFGTDASALLDTSAFPNIISAELGTHLKLAPRVTQKLIKLAYGSKPGCVGRFYDLPRTFDDLTVHCEYLTVTNTLLGIVPGAPVEEIIRAVMDSVAYFVNLSHEGKML